MGDEVKRLALIDAGKFNALMEMFTENNNRQKLLSDAKRSAEEAGLIESRSTVLKSVKNKSSTAGNDVINYLKKTDNYRRSVGLDNEPDDEPDATAPPAPPAATAGPSGANYKAGTVAASTAKIEEHFRKNGVKPSQNGVNFAGGTIGVSYNDMLEYLTRNYIQTAPNLDEKKRHKVLLLSRKTNMPVSFIRNKKIKEEYKSLLRQGSMIPIAPIARRRLPTTTPCQTATPRQTATPQTPQRPLKRPRDYLNRP